MAAGRIDWSRYEDATHAELRHIVWHFSRLRHHVRIHPTFKSGLQSAAGRVWALGAAATDARVAPAVTACVESVHTA